MTIEFKTPEGWEELHPPFQVPERITLRLDDEGKTRWFRPIPPIPPLPTAPGSVIAIGGWWFVRLASWSEPRLIAEEARDQQASWELLPARSHRIRESMERAGYAQQCVYGEEQVWAEVQQNGGYVLIAKAVES